MRFVSLLLILAAAVSAQPTGAIPVILPNGAVVSGNQAAPPAETKPEDLGSIEGQVLNARTGEFLNKATLTLTRADPPQNVNVPPPSYNSNTDASGKFSMKDIEPGRYRLRVSRNGFVQGEYGARGPTRPGTTITLDRAKKITDIVFRLTPHGVITGRILDEEGDPVPNVQIQLAKTGYSQGRKQLVYATGASTNDLGEYRMFGVAPGKYLLSATYRNFGFVMPNSMDRSTTSNADEEYVATYYPGTIDPSAAAHVEVTAGSNLSGINLKLSKARTARVKGHVTQGITPGRTMISVMLMPRRADMMTMMMGMNRNRVVDAKGNFELTGVVPGSYYVRATMNANGKNYSGSLPVEVGSRNVENLNVTIGTGLTLTGHLRVDGETTENLSNIQLRLMAREPGMNMFGMSLGKVSDDGSFKLEDVGSDQYNLTLFGLPEGFYVKAIRAGENDVLVSGLDLAGGAPGPLQVVISPRAGALTGTVQNPTTHQPAAGATVVLVPQEKDRRAVFSFYKMTTSDQTGSYSFKNLTPGEYKVFAWEDIEPGAYADPEFVKPVEAKGEAVTIKESAAPAMQVTLIPVEDK